MPDPPSLALAPLEAVALTPPQQELVKILRDSGGPLFAVLDAARDPLKILTMLRSSGEQYQSLYEGLQGQVLEAFAPYLARLPADSRLLETLVAHGWRKNWGIFAVSAADFDTVRKHFRTFLMVNGPDGKRLYFRYYDPRTLRTYLPTCNAGERQFIFGPVAVYLCEGDDPETVLIFKPGRDSTQMAKITLEKTRGEANRSASRHVNQETE